MINLTEAAKNKIIQIANEEGIDNLSVRLSCIGGGCASMTTNIIFDDFITDLDEVFQVDNVKIVVDCISIHYLTGTTVDYEIKNYGEGFTFNNPNAKSSCGCAKSFSI